MNSHDKHELNSIVDKIKATVTADEIYLFGSYADGSEKDDSDFDIYVLLAESEDRPIKSMQKINFALANLDIRSVDIMANYSKAFYANSKALTLEKSILEKGVKLYERNT